MKYTDLCARLDGDLPSIRPNQQWSFRKDLDMPRIEAERKEAAAAIRELEVERDQIAQLAATLQNEAERLHEELSAAEARVAEMTRERDAHKTPPEYVCECGMTAPCMSDQCKSPLRKGAKP